MKSFLFIMKRKRLASITPEILDRHIRHLQNLRAVGQLVLCGPFKDSEGAMQIIRAADRMAAIDIFERDPFIVERYYVEYDAFEFQEADESNNWLAEIEKI
jgi:uncharacterized protein YciI